jgi:hypothetical protein
MSEIRKPSKTQQKIQEFFSMSKRYAAMTKATGIESKRLSQIRRGKGEKPTRSEIGKIARFKIPTTQKTTGQEISLGDIQRSSGMSKDEIRKAVNTGRYKVTKKYLAKDGTYVLKTKEASNYLLMMVIHMNLQTGEYKIGLSKRFAFNILGKTETTYEEFEENGKRYSFTITVYRLHQYTNLKAKVIEALNEIAKAGDDDILQSHGIDTLKQLTGYV